jgi:hypothetical protein
MPRDHSRRSSGERVIEVTQPFFTGIHPVIVSVDGEQDIPGIPAYEVN